MRGSISAAWLSLCIWWAAPASAQDVAGLFDGRTIVTGQGEENRMVGVSTCFSDVLAKVSGDSGLLRRPVPGGTAAAAMTGFSYHDRMSGLPLHDEEGTRRRPYDLTISFDRARVDAALRALGSAPWAGSRPVIVPVVLVERGARAFVLASDGDASYGQRDALQDAAWGAGLPVRLPDGAALARGGLTPAALAGTQPPNLAAFAREQGGEVALAGTLSWSDADVRWTGRWRLVALGREFAWDGRAESFDDAYREAMRGAALALSGHAAGDRFTLP